jgi:hypothetical protein
MAGTVSSSSCGSKGDSRRLNAYRDHPAWFQSTQRLKRLEATTRGRVIPGHDKETFLQLQSEIKDYLS